jgi:hypothetical protein
MSRAFAVVKIGERKTRPVCLDVCTQPIGERNTSSNTECVFQSGCDRGLSLGPKTRAWLRLQLPMKQIQATVMSRVSKMMLYTIQYDLIVRICVVRNCS